MERPVHAGLRHLALRVHDMDAMKHFYVDLLGFAIEWEPGAIRFYVDDTLYKTTTPDNLPAGRAWVFDHPFFLILNVAVGGDWPGNPDSTTVFPQTMLVDYIRVYQIEPQIAPRRAAARRGSLVRKRRERPR